MDFLNEAKDYDDIDLNNSVVYEVEENESEGVVQEESEDEDDEEGLIHLEVNLANQTVAKLIIYDELNFEDDILNFCKTHNLDDTKRKKLQKIVKM